MSQTPQRPDRANDNDFDDIDVPAYRGTTDQPGDSGAAGQDTGPRSRDTNATTRWYQRAGRAAPQSIPPTQGQPTTNLPAQPTQENRTGQVRPQPSVEGAPTTVQGATTGWGANGAPASGRAAAPGGYQESPERQPAAGPHSYADEDFAPTTVTPAPGPAHDPAPATGATAATAAATATDASPHPTQETYVEEPVEARRGTIDLGIFIIRVGLAAWLILESIATFFTLGGSEGLAGLEAEYAGYAFPGILALAVPTAQLAAGLFLLFGLVTPLFAAVATVVTGFTALHALASSGAGLNLFAWPEGVWLSVILLVISVALQFTGPGLYSLDFGRRWARRPLASSWIFIVLAIAGVVAVWWFGTGINPFA
ncbi:DoxX family protein [Corynebacterium guangdongense]|uniref:Membrane protein YphA (DoxX/SURF4 family) n=1 Tax=Corynebacterium guangdongense TaxID=1783348 RepID=A0ABU1ZW68_9CORY|nr:DoxX family membrane protein [Corynebacterium guangdongense]MDR7329174.1 putative membrane protein YphA (DoxX/SURF4 family) [Corynebacterium guangdongense]WJZ17741.1 hypothetical protein CGUA_05795 [Corynebacterium guangdongense]